MSTFTIELGDRKFNGASASAKDQFEALHIAGRSGLITVLKDSQKDMAMVAGLLQVPLNDVRRLIELTMKEVKENDIPVGENLFKDNIQDYYLLLARVLRENLGNFWKLRPASIDANGAEPSQS